MEFEVDILSLEEQPPPSQPSPDRKSDQVGLQFRYDTTNEKLEVGVDEVARGCLFGRVYAAVVIWGNDPPVLPKGIVIRDSKKMSKRQREKASEFIKQNALAWKIAWKDEKYIDQYNILQASLSAMQEALNGLSIEPDVILVDGIHFQQYLSPRTHNWISHHCIPSGDNTYFSIACASILAKVEHDLYIKQLCENNPQLEERYGLLSNMGYGTARHLKGIKDHGITTMHRRSFAPCK